MPCSRSAPFVNAPARFACEAFHIRLTMPRTRRAGWGSKSDSDTPRSSSAPFVNAAEVLSTGRVHGPLTMRVADRAPACPLGAPALPPAHIRIYQAGPGHTLGIREFLLHGSSDKPQKVKARLPRGFADRGPADIAATEAHAGRDPRDLRALRLRGGRDAVRRIHRRARQVPARPGPAERGRVLVPGRRRAVAVAALRPDRAARPLRRREFRRAAEALSQLSLRLGVPQREARPGPLPPVHAVRRRHGGRALASPPTPRSA